MTLDRKNKLLIGLGVVALILLGKLFYIQIIDDKYKTDAANNSMKYETIFKRYIYKPMYDHFNDPANEALIRSRYPDFPFGDFPNPYPEK